MEYTNKQIALSKEYYENNAKKLYQIVDNRLKKYGGLADYDYFYAIATDVFTEAIGDYDGSIPFENFLKVRLYNKINSEIRNRNRFKRSNTRPKRDVNGNIARDENGKIQYEFSCDVSFDEPLSEDGWTLKDIIEDKKTNTDEFLNENTSLYLKNLSDKQKQIADLIMKNYSPTEIREELNITNEQYTKLFNDMRSFEKRLILKKDDSKEVEEKKQVSTQTFEKSKTDRLSIASLIKKIEKSQIRFNHPLQRPSDQWTPAMKGNLVSDILQGNPIPPLVLAEQIVNNMPYVWNLDGKQRSTNSYDFTKDKFKVTKNIRRWNIEYTVNLLDGNGNEVMDENGFPLPDRRSFDIRRKKFSDLPEELQEKFMDYNFEIVQYINCSAEDIAYHIARYNEGKPMSAGHKSIIRLGETFASTVKGISAMPFFKEKGAYTVAESNNGTVDRVVVESVMAANFLDKWIKTPNEMCEFIRDNASQEQFDNFEDMVTRLQNVGNDEVFEKFNSKDSFLYFGLYARFINTGLNDDRFIEFMTEFSQSLHSKVINGISYDDLCVDKETGKIRSTKDKYIVVPKIELLEKLMNEYMRIHIEKIDSSEYEQVAKIIQEDKNFYEDMLSDLSVNVDNSSKLLDKQNRPSILALIAYSCQNYIDLDNWFIDYFKRNSNYIADQNKNYLHMKQDLERWITQKGKKPA